MDIIPSNQNILFISEETDAEGLETLKNEAPTITDSPVRISLDQKYLENNKVSADGIIQVSYNDLRTHLQGRRYDKIVFFSISPRIFQIIDGSDTSKTDIIFRSNPSYLYRKFDTLNRPYFSSEVHPSLEQNIAFGNNDRTISLYNDMGNIKWLFSSSSEQALMETMLGFTLKNAFVIQSVVELADLKPSRQIDASKIKVCVIKDFSNTNYRAVDVDIKAILELSKSPLFDMFDISIHAFGKKHDFDILVAPVKDLVSIKLHNQPLSISEIALIAGDNDILLSADRFNSNKHAIITAATLNCLPITSNTSSIKELSSTISTVLAPTDDYKQMARIMEGLAATDSTLQETAERASKEVKSTINKNVESFKKALLAKNADQTYPYTSKDKQPILSVIVPSYNVSPYLRNVVFSLINHPLSHKLEVIIVNDGSKDDTAKIAKDLVRISKTPGGSIVTLIDKENGGHGSTINAGIEMATGKYFRLLDGDDYVMTDNLMKLITILEKEDSDIVLTDLVEDYGISAEMVFKDYYKALIPGEQRDLDFMDANGYGFGEWGPLLSTTNVKTEILKKANFKIDENCFYVDMEYNFIIYSLSKTITYYPLVIYSYYLGRVGQSMSKESLKRNVLHHEKVTLRLLSEYQKRKSTLSQGKRTYLENKMIIPMCKSQYYIATEMFKDGSNFLSFDDKLKKYPEFYNNSEIAGKIIRLHRKMNGATVRIDSNIKALRNRLKRD